MSNSGLVNYTRISPNKSVRTQKITKITPHYMAGNLSVETCGSVFAPSSRQASSNYGIGSDGRIGMYVPEDYRAWTSSSAWNDQRAVTIEVANVDTFGTVTPQAWNALVNLCVDICKRNGIPKLEFTGNSNGSLTWHCFYSDTSCPGQYLKNNTQRLAIEVNAKLKGQNVQTLTIGELMSMDCIIQPNNQPHLDVLIGGHVHSASCPDEVEAAQKVYRACNGGKNMPSLVLGTPEAPWASRFYDLIERGIDRKGVPRF